MPVSIFRDNAHVNVVVYDVPLYPIIAYTESDSCAYLPWSMGNYHSSKYPFFSLWVFVTVTNTHWNFEWVFDSHNGQLLP